MPTTPSKPTATTAGSMTSGMRPNRLASHRRTQQTRVTGSRNSQSSRGSARSRPVPLDGPVAQVVEHRDLLKIQRLRSKTTITFPGFLPAACHGHGQPVARPWSHHCPVAGKRPGAHRYAVSGGNQVEGRMLALSRKIVGSWAALSSLPRPVRTRTWSGCCECAWRCPGTASRSCSSWARRSASRAGSSAGARLLEAAGKRRPVGADALERVARGLRARLN